MFVIKWCHWPQFTFIRSRVNWLITSLIYVISSTCDFIFLLLFLICKLYYRGYHLSPNKLLNIIRWWWSIDIGLLDYDTRELNHSCRIYAEQNYIRKLIYQRRAVYGFWLTNSFYNIMLHNFRRSAIPYVYVIYDFIPLNRVRLS